MSESQKDKIDRTLKRIVDENEERIQEITRQMAEDRRFVYRQSHLQIHNLLTDRQKAILAETLGEDPLGIPYDSRGMDAAMISVRKSIRRSAE